MVNEPERYLEAFAQAGADSITVHEEACVDLRQALGKIRSLGKRAGVALKPETPADTLQPYLAALDLVLVLCVSPGQGGQAFQESQLAKIDAFYARRVALKARLDAGLREMPELGFPQAQASGFHRHDVRCYARQR